MSIRFKVVNSVFVVNVNNMVSIMDKALVRLDEFQSRKVPINVREIQWSEETTKRRNRDLRFIGFKV